jgi:hypothetical protein
VPVGGEGEGPGSCHTHLINKSKKIFGDGDEERREEEEEEEEGEDAGRRFILPMTQGGIPSRIRNSSRET